MLAEKGRGPGASAGAETSGPQDRSRVHPSRLCGKYRFDRHVHCPVGPKSGGAVRVGLPFPGCRSYPVRGSSPEGFRPGGLRPTGSVRTVSLASFATSASTDRFARFRPTRFPSLAFSPNSDPLLTVFAPWLAVLCSGHAPSSTLFRKSSGLSTGFARFPQEAAS